MLDYEAENGESDSEAELQEAFSRGLLKPGLNIEEGAKVKRKFVNNEAALNRKLNSFVLKLPWIERLDLSSKQAALAPELAAKILEEKEKLAKSGNTNDPLLNDFEREMMFHRQAQSAVLVGMPRLKELGIVTKRPDDYFAEMAKSDSHMQKVRTALMQKQQITARIEKVRHIRKMRKVNKELEKKARVQKENEKREFLNQVKKYRQKMTNDLSFLESKPKRKPQPDIKKGKKRVNRKVEAKRKYKQEKYGMGGRKKGQKHNTKESSADVSGRGPKKNARNTKKPMKRPGKSKRQKQRAGKKR